MNRRSSTPWTIRLAGRAERDFVEILEWTAQTFGARQARTYAQTLSLAMDALVGGPDVAGGTQRDEIGPGIRTLHVQRLGRKGRHFIIFRVGGERTIDVLRLLHDSMDLARQVEASDEGER